MPKLNKQDKEKLITLYKQGKSTYNLAEIFNISQAGIHYHIKKANIGRSLAEANIQNEFDRNYFNNINNEYKAYWLGFIYADGCILVSDEWRQNRLVITLSIRDIDHLYKFKKHIGYTGNINTYWKECPKAGMKEYCRIAINNKTLIKGLIKNGATPRKTHTLSFPDLPKNLYSHFIRGYFDGDGMISTRKDRAYVFSITSTKSFLEKVVSILKKECAINTLNITSDRTMFRIAKSRYTDVINIMNWLYKDSNVYLERKYAKYLSGPLKRT